MERHVDRVIVRPQAVEFRIMSSGSNKSVKPGGDEQAPAEPATTTLMLPWAAPSFVAVKGIALEPAAKPTMAPETRDALLAAIARPGDGLKTFRLGRVATLAEIADREGLGERHVRLMAPLAFVAPRIVAPIADGTAPADLTIIGFARRLPHACDEQERRAFVAA